MTTEDVGNADAIHHLLRALPRQKITPETIDQRTIDHWYKREDHYRQLLSAIAEHHQAAETGSRVCVCGLPDCPTAILVTGQAPPMTAYIERAIREVRDGLAGILHERAEAATERAEAATSSAQRETHQHTAQAWSSAALLLSGDGHVATPAAADLVASPEEQEIRDELARQDATWGQQDHPDLDPRDYDFVTRNEYAFRAQRWKDINEERTRTTVTPGYCRGHSDYVTPHPHTAWDGILLEEVYEALAEPDPDKLYTELVQVEAVARQWRAALRRRAAAEPGGESTP
ncbi:hypothetical protein ACFWYW_46850 [Nonomuraea sp. NPDC059023]|uniref:hypothetical protein n=1 Tax=unclassified Nonomuraea TaxID=2593643 RepID=UPI0036CE26E6